jgi:hypothetical protein
MARTVHLEDVRCDGSDHDGCEAGCLIFWKEAWLKRADGEPSRAGETQPRLDGRSDPALCTVDTLQARTKAATPDADGEPFYVCQNTQIKFASQHQEWWDLRQYLEDYTSGNVSLRQLAAGLLYSVWRTVTESGAGVGSAMRWIYDTFQRARGGVPYPIRPFGVPDGTPVPRDRLDLQPGERVRVKPFGEILKTLDSNYRNRGLYFDPEMVPFTERTYEVDRRQSQIIDERTGKMVRFKTDAIILKDVVCQARYATCRRFCPRAIYPYWREIWLERAPDGTTKAGCHGACKD